ncbi:maleylpyruvate isomerase [Kitasatospora sp. MAA4]|uniref:maleylpyruvate isomerase family mycothiol-dependent enzyme n=1 Tax=Kitasatospora sp. MAA4 TaxID=3035093 RepID=UPI002475BE17|nr:maleylpyruvate isomerase family mycothiol-dependent enzyme [Kitasatospora sp. MAA4]MDH6132708.1 maleylpyruvate isomerase [Kitasatospora sp. MAA4]
MLDLIADVTRSGTRLTAALDALTDAEVGAPSTLPGWTRGQVVTHLVHGVDAYLWLLATARTGAEPGPRTDAAVLARELQDGAARPAGELAADLRTRLARLADVCASMPADRWDTLVTALAGWRHPAWYVLHRCRRELETHHVDLDIGYRSTDWPGTYVTWALDDTLAALAARDFPLSRVEAPDLGRSWTLAPTGATLSGPGHAVLGWLSGRATDAPLTADRPLSTPPSWPLPPAPGWS